MIKSSKVTAAVCTLAAAMLCVPTARPQDDPKSSKSAGAPSSGSTVSSAATANEQVIWYLEHAYWRYVQDNNLPAYTAQWHKNFLGWPAMSAEPVRKDHITDWITSQTAKGLAFKSGEFKPGGVQITGNVAVVHYHMSFEWLDKSGAGTTSHLRVTHTWIKNGANWQIIGGMSMPEPAPQP